MSVPKEDRSIGSLLADLTNDLTALVRKEIQLAKAEMSEKATQVGNGVMATVIGAVVCLAGLLVLLAAAVLALGEGIGWNPLWLPPLIIGLIVGVIGVALLIKGRSNLKATNLTPERTVSSLRKDSQIAQERFK